MLAQALSIFSTLIIEAKLEGGRAIHSVPSFAAPPAMPLYYVYSIVGRFLPLLKLKSFQDLKSPRLLTLLVGTN